MPPIEFGPKGPQAARALGAVDLRKTRSGGAIAQESGPVADPAPATVTRSTALDPGQAPVDSERVATIRKAIESGNYPVIPMRVADAMIAAGYLLRSGK
jgi:negative regulator of flagellin synthesis FlgM